MKWYMLPLWPFVYPFMRLMRGRKKPEWWMRLWYRR